MSFLSTLLLISSLTIRASESFSWSLASPDAKCSITVRLEDGSLSYSAAYRDGVVIQKSPLGLRRDDQDFTSGLIFGHAASVVTQREKYDLLAGVQSHVDHLLNHRQLFFYNTNHAPFGIELAAGNEGVAFRYIFPKGAAGLHVVTSELTSFTLAPEARGWMQPYHGAGPYTPAYEDFFFPVAAGDAPPQSRATTVGWAFPALFHVPSASAWVLLTESGTDEAYCACHLSPDCSNGVYHIAFPLGDEATHGVTNLVGPEPRYTLPWTMPWRLIEMGASAGDIAVASLVTDLAPPSRITNTSWIHPGRAAWAWWSYPDTPATVDRFNEFTDFAAKMGWEYTLFDAGWHSSWLKPLAQHALAEHVQPLAWLPASDFYDPARRKAKLDQMQTAGIRGIKVDFWCSDRQEAMVAQQELMSAAAARKMLVNYHGCSIPRGWQRTWPNFITTEAVLGSESYFYESRYTEKAAELDTVLPFTRNAVGPMDLTPVACTPTKYERLTTATHQLASVLVFSSGIIHFADKPEFFESLPAPALQILKDAPARWDETRCLAGDPGREVIFARRAGQTWYIAGMNGTAATLPVTLDLSAFQGFPNRLLVAEGANANLEVTATPLDTTSTWQHEIPPRGGFILRLDK